MIRLSQMSTRVGGVGVRAIGMTGEAQEGRAAATRGESRRSSVLDEALLALLSGPDAPGGFSVRSEISIHPDADAPRPSRGTGGDNAAHPGEPPRLEIEGPSHEPGELAQLLVIEEDGLLRFEMPRPGTTNEFDVVLGERASGREERGILSAVGGLTIRLLGVVGGRRLMAQGTRATVRALEDRLRPHQLRTFTPDNFSRRLDESTAAGALLGGSALLLLHGVNSSSHSCFRFSKSYVAELQKRYGGRVLAFDHPSLACSPKENAEALAAALAGSRLDNVDILAHSRGGLVARELLADKPDELNVRSVVFVGTPSGGTPMADAAHLGQFLSVATNLLSLIPDNPVTDVVSLALDVLREWVIEPIIGGLPGIAAMHPSSVGLRRLNEQNPPHVTFRAVAAAYEPRSDHGALRRMRDLVMDGLFLGVENDLLVPTRSAYARREQFHIPSNRRLVLDSSFGVCHSTFWTDATVLRSLDEWLNPAKGVDEATPVAPELRDAAAEFDDALATGRMAAIKKAMDVLGSDKVGIVSDLLGGPLPVGLRGHRTESKRGTVIVLPGIMGSHLEVDGRLVWFSPWNLARGRFTELRLGDARSERVRPAGLLRQYGPIIAHLDQSWDVVPFAYDWRLSIQDGAEQLEQHLERHGVLPDGKGPVHFVGHSMGGLVARWFLASRSDRWTRDGRLLQLGTPNWGSFAMPLAMLGEERIVRALAFADLVHEKAELLQTLASFPAFVELFPSPTRSVPGADGLGHAHLYERDVWASRGFATEGFDHLLADAKAFYAELAAFPDSGQVVYVAGDGHQTPYRARVDTSGELSFGVTTLGDGRVTHDFGFGSPDSGPVYYSDSSHGDLIGDARVLAALDELLESGATTLLPTEPKARRSATPDDRPEWVKAADLEQSLGYIDPVGLSRGASTSSYGGDAALEEASAIYVGRLGEPRSAVPPLRVRVVHGSLEQARHPVAAGRYKGIPIGGALGFIDQRFDGALTELHQAGLYPDEAGTGRFLRAGPDVYPKGAILLGLGEFGSLTPDLLARAVERGTSDYALAARRISTEPTIGVSAVLVGTPGRYGLTVTASIAATIRGVARAKAQLKGRVTITELEFIELSESRADEAAAALDRLKASAELAWIEAPIEIDVDVETRPGGRPGSRGYEETGAPWPRLMLELDHPPGDVRPSDPPDDELRKLRYVSMARRAQARDLEVDVSLSQIARHVRNAVDRPQVDEQTRNTLFELLLPNEAKLELESFDNLQLLVDTSTAWIPWEMISGRETTGQLSQPLALRAGLLRQLKSPGGQTPPRSVLDEALVIGDPPTGRSGLPRLAGAHEEATVVADVLDAGDFAVTRMIYGRTEETSERLVSDLIDTFYSRHYRVIHIAAHGQYEPGSTNVLKNGVVIGPHDILGPLQFKQRLVVPDLVFLNCCHIGRIDNYSGVSAAGSHYAHLAASVAVELMRSGVSAVIAAGWAVNDRAAFDFGATFYEQMLRGQTLGNAVREARLTARGDSQDNTWAAYQCYGDPDFQLVTKQRTRRGEHRIFSKRNLLNELQVLEKRAGDAVHDDHVAGVRRMIEDLETKEVPRFSKGDDAEVWVGLAKAYAEAGAFDDAVFAYRRALALDKMAKTSIRTIESYRQLANLEARLGAQRDPRRASPGAADPLDDPRRVDELPEELFREAETRLKSIRQLDGSAEWYAIMGSLYKKRASTRARKASQRADVRRSMDAYLEACRLARDVRLEVYHGSLALLMAHVLGWPDDTGAIKVDFLARLQAQVDEYDANSGDYWERAERADVLATQIVTSGELVNAARCEAVVEEFTRAFRVRSTRRQRLSVIDNYLDLAILLPTEDERGGARAIAERLREVRPAHGFEVAAAT